MRNIFIVAFEKAATIGLSFLFIGVFSRCFTAAEFGIWTYTLSFVSFIAAIGIFMPSEILLPLMFKGASAENILTWAAKVRLLGCSFSCIIWLLCKNFEFMGLDFWAVIFLPVIFGEFFQIYTVALIARGDFTYLTATRIMASVFKLGALIVVATLNLEVEAVAVCLLTESLVVYLLSRYRYFSNVDTPKYFEFDSMSTFLSGLSFIPTVILTLMFFRIDKFILKEQMNPDVFGAYAASAQIIESIIAVSVSMSIAWLPHQIYTEECKINIRKKILDASLVYVLIGILVSALIFFLAEFISSLLWPNYYYSGYMLRAMAFMLPPVILDNMISIYLAKVCPDIILKKLVITYIFFYVAIKALGMDIDQIDTPYVFVASTYVGLTYTLFRLRRILWD